MARCRLPLHRRAERDPKDEADRFARTTFRASTRGRVKLAEIRAAYHAWCRKHGLEPLPDLEIGSALSALFSSVGLYRRGKGLCAVIVGMEWNAGGRRCSPIHPSPAAERVRVFVFFLRKRRRIQV